jgi:hypothetical protein
MNDIYNAVKGRTLLQCVLFLLALSINSTATAASSYLQELEAEAAATDEGSNDNATAAKPNWTEQQPEINHETIEKGLTKAEFEQALKSRFYGSYLFYSALNDAKQAVVYEEYKNNNDIEHLREVIKAQMTN